VPRPVIWIDRAVADFSKESILVTKWSDEDVILERMARADFRTFIEDSVRKLDAEDRKDQRDTARIGKRRKH